METRPFGTSGLAVSVLGFGAGQIGEASLAEDAAGRLLNEVLDLGVTLVDTARGYGLSEERIGRHLAHRRDAFVLSTKGGYAAEGAEDWTSAAVTRGVEDALRRLRTNRIDVFHLHSCPRDVLARGDVVDALTRAVRAGKVRVAAYSGENDALDEAVASGCFGAVQCSVNVCDQGVIAGAIAAATRAGMGVIGKRPIANAAFRFASRPVGDYAECYWERLEAMDLDRGGVAFPEYMLRFSAFAPGVASVIVGTRSLEHVRANAAIVAKGALPAALVEAARRSFMHHADIAGGWPGQV